jgi:hypothetical protein
MRRNEARLLALHVNDAQVLLESIREERFL